MWVETPEWAAILSFTQVFVLWSLNTIATSIENPFGRDANDIDGTLMQCEFNEWLRMCLLPHVDRSPSLSEDFEVEGKELGMADILTCRKSRGLHTILRDTMTQLQEHLEADMHQDDSLSSTSDRGSEAQSELKLQLAVSALAAASAVMEEGVRSQQNWRRTSGRRESRGLASLDDTRLSVGPTRMKSTTVPTNMLMQAPVPLHKRVRSPPLSPRSTSSPRASSASRSPGSKSRSSHSEVATWSNGMSDRPLRRPDGLPLRLSPSLHSGETGSKEGQL